MGASAHVLIWLHGRVSAIQTRVAKSTLQIVFQSVAAAMEPDLVHPRERVSSSAHNRHHTRQKIVQGESARVDFCYSARHEYVPVSTSTMFECTHMHTVCMHTHVM